VPALTYLAAKLVQRGGRGMARLVDTPDVTRIVVGLARLRCRLTCVKADGLVDDRVASRLVGFRQEASMARYVARFMKNVLGENGHEAEICQRSIEIEAPSVIDATELAKMKFCETERVGNWLLHADRVHLTDAEFPS
jgi:hypothetical protein